MPRDLYEHCIKEMEENKDEPYSVSNEFGEALFAYAQKHYAYAQIRRYYQINMSLLLIIIRWLISYVLTHHAT